MPKLMPDDNDRLRAGTLPADPAADAEPMPPEPGSAEASLPREIGSFMGDALGRMRRRADGTEKPIALPWPSVNEALGGGLWPGMLHVLAGTTGAGKTILAMEAALASARAGVPVLYVSLELGPDEMVARLLGLMSREKWSGLYLGRARDDEDPRGIVDKVAREHGPELGALPLRLEVGAPMGHPPERLWSAANAMRASLPEEHRGARPFLVVLDYLQLIGRGEREDLRVAIQRAAYYARAIARDLDAAVLVLSSVARGQYANLKIEPGKKLPPPSLLVGIGKESGEIEFAADVVLALADEEWAEGEKSKAVHLAVAKSRTGTPSWVPLRFNGGWFAEPERQEGKAFKVPAPKSARKGTKR